MINISKLKDKLSDIRNHSSKEKLKTIFLKSKNSVKDFCSNINKEDINKYLEKLRNLFNRESFSKNKKNYAVISLTGVMIIAAVVAVSINHSKTLQEISQKNYKKAINEAEENYYKGRYNDAIKLYENLNKKGTRQGLWYVKIAEIYSVKGDMETSNKYAAKARQLGNNNAEVLNYAVFTEFMNKDTKLALEHGKEALSKFPKDKSLIKTMFTIYMASNELDKAKLLINTYPLDEESAYDRAEYAKMLVTSGLKEEGYKQLKAAWDIDKDEYKIYDVLSQTAVYNRDELLEDVTKLSQKNPGDLAYKMWLAKVYSLNEATASDANKLLEGIKDENAGKIEIKLIEASILQNTNQIEKGEELIKRVINENKNDYRVLHTAGWYYLNKVNFAQAEKYCKESISKNKNYTDNYGFLMPEILKAEGRTKEGEPYFRTAIFKEPYNYNIMLTIANYYWYTTKDTLKALEYFKIAESVKPYDSEIKYNMAQINISNNRTEEAVKLLKECIKLSDDTAKYHRTLGTIYLLNGKPKEAIQETRYGYAADEQDILTLNNAGCYYITQDVNLVKGEYNLRKALEGINASTDKYTSDTIKSNYKKVKEFIDKYNKQDGGEIKIPELVLFY